jgi:hypothetical protein
MNELEILNINNVDYPIRDKSAQDQLTQIKSKQVVTDVALKSTYTQETKTLTLSLTVTKGGLINE